MNGLLTDEEANAVTPNEALLAAVTDAIVQALRFPKCEESYQLALRGLSAVPREAWWVIELTVEADCHANDVPMRWGLLRCSPTT